MKNWNGFVFRILSLYQHRNHWTSIEDHFNAYWMLKSQWMKSQFLQLLSAHCNGNVNRNKKWLITVSIDYMYSFFFTLEVQNEAWLQRYH